MRNLLIPAILLFASAAWAQDPSCGLLNDRAVHVAPHYAQATEPHFDGSQLSMPPSVGGTYVDPVFGCTVKRLTNGPAQYQKAMRHEYSSMTAINQTDTLMEVMDSNGEWSIIDLSGNIIVPEGNVSWSGGIGARWAPDQANVAYYVSESAGNNGLFKGTVNTTSCAPACTVATTLLHAFSEYTQISFGMGEGDMGDADHLLIQGVKVSDGSGEFFVYTISTDTKGPAFNYGSHDIDNIELSLSNQMVVNWGSAVNPPGSCVAGPCYLGFELFGAACTGAGCSPANANFVRHLYDINSHSVESRDANGNDVLVMLDDYPLVCAQQGILTVKLSDATVTCILNLLPWHQEIHLGTTRFTSGTNWIVASGEDNSSPGAASYPLAPNWNQPTPPTNNPNSAGYWGYLTNEILLLNLDGSKVYRIAHHRSRPGASDYWKTTRANLSRDGKYVVFDSDFGLGQDSPATDYTDVFLISTGIGLGAVKPAPPTGVKTVVF
jgi:hypothetical protein